MEGDTEFWTSHVEACRREGMVASEYARQHGLTPASLYYWRRKLKLATTVDDGGTDSGPANPFVALRVVDAAAGTLAGSCTLVLRSGLRLELAALPSPAWLLALEQVNAGLR
jgi:transposase-like protein